MVADAVAPIRVTRRSVTVSSVSPPTAVTVWGVVPTVMVYCTSARTGKPVRLTRWPPWVLDVTAARPDSASACKVCFVLVIVAVSGSTPVLGSTSIKVMMLPLAMASSPVAAFSAAVKSVTKVLSTPVLATTDTDTAPTATVYRAPAVTVKPDKFKERGADCVAVVASVTRPLFAKVTLMVVPTSVAR